jgi:tetratricopeptide (TPR) repeat protein
MLFVIVQNPLRYMKSASFSKAVLLIAAAVLLVSCSSDPNKLKLKYLKSGENYFKAAKYQEAVIEFRNALEVDPRLAAAHYQLGRAYLALKNPDSAYRELNESVTLDPSNSDAQLQFAALLVARRQFDQAQSVAQQVLDAQPGNVRAHTILGEKYTLAGDFPKAIQEFQKAVELEPHRVENYGALGAAYAAAGQFSEALEAYRKATATNPGSAQAHMSLGQFYFSRGRTAEAEDEMRAAGDLDPHAPPPRLILARIYLATGRTADAEKLYTNLKTIAPKDPEAYRALGNFYASSGQREKAVEEFRSVLSSHPNDDSVRTDLVETLLDLNRIAEAEPLCQQILKANQADARGLLAQGRILFFHGKSDAAKAALEGAVKGDPNSASAHYFLGLVQESAGFPDLAKASFSRALELKPQMALASAALSNLVVKNGNRDEALRLAENAQHANPNLPGAYLARAEAMMAKGDLRQAEAALNDALLRDPASLTALATLLKLSSQEGKVPEVLQRISGLVRQYPQNAGLLFLQGLAYFSLKDLEKSEGSVRRALELDPKTPDAYTLLANIHLAKGASEEAKADLRAAIAAHPRSLVNYMSLVTRYEKEGNWDEAKRLCEKAHEIDASSPFVAAELAFLYLEHGGDVNTAVALAQVAKQKMPDSPVTADALGWAYYKLGSLDAALVQLKESSDKVPNNPVYHYHLGMTYMAARRFGLARQSLTAALRTDPHFPYAANARAALEQIPPGVR